MADLHNPDETVTDDVVKTAIDNFMRLSERKGAPRLEREAFAGMALMLTLMGRDHHTVSELKGRVDKLEKRNIVTWIIDNPKVSVPLLVMLTADVLIDNLATVKSLIGIK